MNAIEPIADAVTGSLAARAAEPSGGIDTTGHTTERSCLNCGAGLSGEYCHACGQKGHVHRSLGAFGHDLLHGVFHFEGKIWRTLPLLLWRPGELTRRYIEGQRASFVSPLALFLFSVFLMFAVVSWSGGFQIDSSRVQTGLAAELKDREAHLADLQAERRDALREGNRARAESLASEIRSTEEEMAIQRAFAERGFAGLTERASDDIPLPSAIQASGTPQPKAGSGSNIVERINTAYLSAKKNPDLLLYKLKSNGYKFSWALIPLSLPLMWLLFPFSRRFRLYDHAVFVTYSLCFMTILVVAVSLLALAGLPSLLLLFLLPPVHMYRQLRGAYALSRGSALWRTLVLTLGSVTILVAFGIGLVLLGLT